MKHLITGGSGFLGNLIARRLYECGQTVRILDIWGDPSRPKEIEYVNCDIRNRDGVAAAMKGVDIVHHNVALVPLTKAGRELWDVAVHGSCVAAEEAVKAGVKSFIHMSSSAIFGAPKVCPITSETPTCPVEAYGRAKLAGELAVQKICEQARLPLIVIRPRTILGEGRLGIFQILFEWIKQGKNVYVFDGGNVPFQFIQAHDLMDAYMLALDLGKPGVYNVGTDRYGTLRQGLTNLIAYAGTRSEVKSLPSGPASVALTILDWLGLSPLAPWHYKTYHKAFYFDITPLLKLGWKPKYSNDEMFRESYNWFIDSYDRLSAEQAGSAHRRPVKEKILGLVKKLF